MLEIAESVDRSFVDDRYIIGIAEKFADCDLIGIPVRLVVSEKTSKGKVELKERDRKETEVVLLEEAISRGKM